MPSCRTRSTTTTTIVGLANDAAALPALADVLSRAQERMTNDDLGAAIDAFAA